MTWDRVLLLATALVGSFLVNLSGQFVPFNIADVAGGLGASADEASWLTTVYSMGFSAASSSHRRWSRLLACADTWWRAHFCLQ
jgi:hypothetical protein